MTSSAGSRWKTVRGSTPSTCAAPPGSAPAVAPAAGPEASPTPLALARPILLSGPATNVPSPLTAPAGAVSSIRTRDDDAESETVVVAEHAVRAAPPWLISAVLHMLLLILLALTSIAEDDNRRTVLIQAGYAEKLGEQLEVDLPGPTGNEKRPDAADPILVDLPLVEDPVAGGPQLDLAAVLSSAGTAPVGTGGDLSVPSIGLSLTGREKGAKRALLAAYGGTSTTEGAVQLGLEWLSRQQDRRSGLWRLNGPYSDGGAADNALAATALALLAFQGAGETHQEGNHRPVVSRGLDALLKMQDAEGNFFREGVANHRLYSQALASIAVCELYGMTKDQRFRKPAQKALDYAVKIQTPHLGGWRYAPRQDTDTSVTGWFVMALQSGLMAGLEVPSPTLEAITKYLDTATKDGSTYAYQRGREETLPMTAEALLCREYLGWQRDDPRLRKGGDYLLQNPVDYDAENVYYWYYATQVLHHLGGPEWEQWNRVMRERVPGQQVADGPERGSWSPRTDRWGLHGGRLFTTCLSIYMLEVYYRHLPIYR